MYDAIKNYDAFMQNCIRIAKKMFAIEGKVFDCKDVEYPHLISDPTEGVRLTFLGKDGDEIYVNFPVDWVALSEDSLTEAILKYKGIEFSELDRLKHRLAMVQDDLNAIQEFIRQQDLTHMFRQPTAKADTCWTHFNNIETACDLSSNECLVWKKFCE